MKKAAEFYLQFLKWDEAKGEYYIYPASPYECESGNDFRNTTSDLSAIRSSFQACIQASERLGTDAAKRSQWRKVLDHLADYPLMKLADGTEAGATALDQDGKPADVQGYGFCRSTASVFPTGTLGIKDQGSRRYNAAAARVRTHPEFSYAISPVAVVAARLGMANEAWKHLSFSVRQLQQFPQGLFYNIDHWDYLSRYAGKVDNGRMMAQRDYITDRASKYKQIGVAGAQRRIDAPTQPFLQCGLEPLSILAEAVNEMLLQSWAQTSSTSGRAPGHPLFAVTETGHGRVETRCVHAFAIEPLKADFPFARSLIVVRNTRWIRNDQSTTEPHYYLSSALPQRYRPPQWLGLIRGHWAGVEVRNHWRRDVLFGEDHSRSRNPNLLANPALIRSALLALLADHFPNAASPPLIEQFARNTNHALKILYP